MITHVGAITGCPDARHVCLLAPWVDFHTLVVIEFDEIGDEFGVWYETDFHKDTGRVDGVLSTLSILVFNTLYKLFAKDFGRLGIKYAGHIFV